MRWVWIILSMVGLVYIGRSWFSNQFSTVAWQVPTLNFNLTWGMIIIGIFAVISISKLHLSK